MNTPARKLTLNPSWKVEQSLGPVQRRGLGQGLLLDQRGRPRGRAARTWTRRGRSTCIDVVTGLRARDLHAPVVIRFSDILAHRLRHLAEAFATAIAENEYRNRYAAVFPIKVNQQRLVVEEVYRYGKEFGFGLEVGSKPELLAVMSITEDAPDRIVVCNGFKDDSYIEAVILATKLGRTIIPVVENFEGDPPDPQARAEATACGRRSACASSSQRGRRPLARLGGREVQVRAVHQRDPRPARAAASRTTCSTACSSCTAIRAASCRTSAASRRRSTSWPMCTRS